MQDTISFRDLQIGQFIAMPQTGLVGEVLSLHPVHHAVTGALVDGQVRVELWIVAHCYEDLHGWKVTPYHTHQFLGGHCTIVAGDKALRS